MRYGVICRNCMKHFYVEEKDKDKEYCSDACFELKEFEYSKAILKLYSVGDKR